MLRLYAALVPLVACGPAPLQVQFYEVDGRAFSWWERATIDLIAEAAAREVSWRLPELPGDLPEWRIQTFPAWVWEAAA